MKKFKSFVVLLLVLFMGTALTQGVYAVSNAGEGQKKTVKMLVPGYDSGYLNKELNSAIEKFHGENPDIAVEIISVGWEELNSKIVQLYQAKQAPDIMVIGSRSLRQFADMGILEDLTPKMTEEFRAPRIENVLKTGEVGGKQFGIPMAFSSRALYYRTDLITEAPKNWEELLSAAKKVNEEKGIYGFAFPTDLKSGTDEILNFIYQGNGSLVDEQGNFTIDSPENIETLTYMNEFKDVIPDPVSTKREDLARMFANGDLAMYISGPWEKEEMDKGTEKAPYGVAVLPEGKVQSVTLVTDSYAVSSISENKDEAFKFIEFMGQFDQQKEITKAHNWFPVLKEEEKLPQYGEDFMKPFMEIISSGHPEPQVPNWDDFNKSFVTAVQKSLTGTATPEEALKEAQEESAK